MKMVAIHDSKAEAYMTPIFVQATGMAIRSFSDAINGDGEFAKHPEDYTLFLLGDFDELSGKVEVYPAPVALTNGVSVKGGVE
jgi:hypothetical protein